MRSDEGPRFESDMSLLFNTTRRARIGK